jgi:FixJ family two-component response regulator
MSENPEGAALVIAADAALRDSLVFLLETFGLAVTSYACASECPKERRSANETRILVIFQATSALGLDVVRDLRCLDGSPPVIILAGKTHPASTAEAARTGITILETPTGAGELVDAVEAALLVNTIRRSDS